MIILGIDPGSIRIGYGAIKLENKKLSLIDYGSIEVLRQKIDARILKISEEIKKIIKKYKPDIIGIEKLYFTKNVKTGIEVAETRGAIILKIAQYKIPVKEFSPSEIKLNVTNYGLSDKKAVAKMVMKILELNEIKGFDDASDALAIAITTANNVGVDSF